MPLPFGRTGYLQIGTVVYPAMNIQVGTPRTLMVPPIVGRNWQWIYGEGVRVTRLSAQILIRDKANEALSDTFLNLFFSRTAAGDTSSVTIEWDDGVRRNTLSNAKGEFISLAAAKGDLLVWNVTFVAPSVPTFAARVSVTPPDAAAPLTFANLRASITGVTQDIYALEFSVANNHVLDAPIMDTASTNYGLGGSAYDAGIFQAGASLTFKALNPANPIPESTSMTIQIVGTSAKTRNFVLQNLVAQNPDDVTVTVGPTYRTIRYMVLGTTANAPITIGGTGF